MSKWKREGKLQLTCLRMAAKILRNIHSESVQKKGDPSHSYPSAHRELYGFFRGKYNFCPEIVWLRTHVPRPFPTSLLSVQFSTLRWTATHPTTIEHQYCIPLVSQPKHLYSSLRRHALRHQPPHFGRLVCLEANRHKQTHPRWQLAWMLFIIFGEKGIRR